MRLTELDPKFLKVTSIDEDGRWTCATNATMGDCDGIEFLCPLCFLANQGARGTHPIICWKPSVPPTFVPGPGRWNQEGTGLNDLSLVAGSSSIKLEGGCRWHGFVQGGEVHTDLSPERVAEVRAMRQNRNPDQTPLPQETPQVTTPQAPAETVTVGQAVPPGHEHDPKGLRFINGILHQLFVKHDPGHARYEHWRPVDSTDEYGTPLPAPHKTANVGAPVGGARIMGAQTKTGRADWEARGGDEGDAERAKQAQEQPGQPAPPVDAPK